MKRKHRKHPVIAFALVFCYSTAIIAFFTYGFAHGHIAIDPDELNTDAVIMQAQEPGYDLGFVSDSGFVPESEALPDADYIADSEALLDSYSVTGSEVLPDSDFMAGSGFVADSEHGQLPHDDTTRFEPPPDVMLEHGSGAEPVYLWYDGEFELPISGATGFASVPTSVYAGPNIASDKVFALSAGEGFVILSLHGDWWFVQNDIMQGYVLHETCFINLPDVLPSIVYDITNAYSSAMRSGGMSIPNITGEMLYEAKEYNDRLGREEFTVPTLYSTAKKLAAAQRAALAEGNTIIVYEGFRPREAQQRVATNFSYLVSTNREVSSALGGWGMNAFISRSLSNHQRGGAIDAGLGVILSKETSVSGGFGFNRITEYGLHVMPSHIHELSARSIVFRRPVDTRSETAWRNATFAATATDGAKLLQKYMTDAGFTPIASEWWHFNDLASLSSVSSHNLTGDFLVPSIFSVPPISVPYTLAP